MMETEAIRPGRANPAGLVQEAVIEHLRGVCGGFANPIPVTQIRGMLDVSGTPKDAYGIIVACDDLGEHWGRNNGGVLIDVKPRVLCFTHMNEDSDGSLCSALTGDVLEAMRMIKYDLDGWDVAWGGNWSASSPVMDGNYRQVELSATLPLVRLYR